MASSGPSTNFPITSAALFNGTNFVIHGTNNNGGANFHYVVLATTNLTVPLSNWARLATNAARKTAVPANKKQM